jgi:hypothetical protein
MKRLLVVLVPAAFIAVMLVTHLIARSEAGRERRSHGPGTLEGKLGVLSKYGLHLAKPYTVDSLLEEKDRHEYEKSGYQTLLVQMGMASEEHPERYLCDNLRYVYFACIEENGDYAYLVEQVDRMCGGALGLKDVKDELNRVRGEAKLRFTFKGKRKSLEFPMKGEYVNFRLFEELAELLEEADPDRALLFYDLGGFDGVFACVTEKQYEGLRYEGIGFGRIE